MEVAVFVKTQTPTRIPINISIPKAGTISLKVMGTNQVHTRWNQKEGGANSFTVTRSVVEYGGSVRVKEKHTEVFPTHHLSQSMLIKNQLYYCLLVCSFLHNYHLFYIIFFYFIYLIILIIIGSLISSSLINSSAE